MTCLMSMILTLVFAVPLWLQDAPTAAQVLERAAVFQRGEAPVPPPSRFRGRFFLQAAKPDGTGMVALDVEREYAREPERMHTRRHETSLTGLDSDRVYDRGTIWIRDRHTDEVVICNEDPETFIHEMDQVREQLRLSRLLLDVLTVDGLAARLEEPRWIGEATLDLGDAGRARDQRLVDLVVGRLPDELFPAELSAPPPLPGAPGPRLQVELAVGRQDGALYRVHLTTVGRAQPLAYVVRMKSHAPNRDGLRLPQSLRIQDGDGRELARIGAQPDAEGFPDLVLDGPLDADRYRVPGAPVPAGADAADEPPTDEG